MERPSAFKILQDLAGTARPVLAPPPSGRFPSRPGVEGNLDPQPGAKVDTDAGRARPLPWAPAVS